MGTAIAQEWKWLKCFGFSWVSFALAVVVIELSEKLVGSGVGDFGLLVVSVGRSFIFCVRDPNPS